MEEIRVDPRTRKLLMDAFMKIAQKKEFKVLASAW
ncbi:hypothetical protein QFZ77_004587 [Paenibacillus sp. V4I3]|nr:hypothetical protein [Paenibacillus sp. V4I3]